APEDTPAEDIFSFHRSNDFDHVAAEVKAVREAVGITEIANFAKYKVTGADAEGWLSHILTNRMPRVGRIVLSPMLNHQGKLIGDFTVARTAPDTFYMFGSSSAQEYHMRWFERHLPADGTVAVEQLGQRLVGLSIAGPKARDVLANVTGDDVSGDAFRFMDFREMDVAGVPALVGRISFTGDLGYEMWVEPCYERKLYDTLMERGAAHGLKNFGVRALLSMRLEKNFPTWARELRPIYGPFEADMDRFVDLKKNDFIGREAAARERDEGPALKRITLAVDAADADVIGDEPIWHDGKVVGWVTSGGYAHHVAASLAQGYVPAGLANATANGAFEVEILGEKRAARFVPEPLFDPSAERMRHA
ncbi:MAG: aminomethyltransferase family protein, partial [Pseudomonadota bacterium]